MRICTLCNKELPETSFNYKIKSKGILQSRCRQCCSALDKANYAINRSKRITDSIARNHKYRIQNIEWKSKLSCVCCGENYIKCVEFHHLDQSTKEHTPSNLLLSTTLNRFLEEAKLCIVVCANCHRKIHGGLIQVEQKLIDKSSNMINSAAKSINR